MGFDRRRFLTSLGALAIPACSPAQPPAAQPNLPRWWTQFRDTFVQADGRIVDTGNRGVSHSEGQSYGMFCAVRAGDRKSFDLIWQWAEANLARPDMAIYAWRYDPAASPPVADGNNAADGDILIAWALSLAADRWHDTRYAERAAAVRNAVADRLLIERSGRTLLLPGIDGFANGGHTVVNLSYYIWPALDRFAREDPVRWGKAITDGEALLAAARFGALQLPTDWIQVDADGAVRPAQDKPPRFGFDAIRVPLYAAAGGRQRLVQPIRTWWQGIVQAGAKPPAWVDVLTGEVAPYPLSEGGMAVVGRLLGNPIRAPMPSDYFAAALQTLVVALP